MNSAATSKPICTSSRPKAASSKPWTAKTTRKINAARSDMPLSSVSPTRRPKLKTRNSWHKARSTSDVIESGGSQDGPAGHYQAAPQRGRIARRSRLRTDRAATRSVQGRSAGNWACNWACPKISSGGIRSPAPGLAVRCLGAVSKTRLDTLREADAIVVEEIKAAGLYRKTAQSFAVLLPIQSVGVMGDARTYEDRRCRALGR